MKIGIVIGRIGGVDGVALETEKWIEVFHELGHEVFILAGQFEERAIDHKHETLLPVLSFFSPECQWGQNKAFFAPDPDPEPLLQHIEIASNRIAVHIVRWIQEKKIDVLLSENASALACHLSMGIGIRKAIQKTGIPVVTHDHDFHWERGFRYTSQHYEVNKLINKEFPLQLPGVKHAVINTNAQRHLKKHHDIDAMVIANVMDFDRPFGVIKEENKKLHKDLGLNGDDIPLFQVTRIVERKGIEVAIELIHRLEDKRVKLVITGNYNDDQKGQYYHKLIEDIHDLYLMDQVIFADKLIRHHSWIGKHESRAYSLSDAYAHAKACTYFSVYEGFGNAFIESVIAKKPIFVNNYKPVFWPDIGSKGFKLVMLENNNLTDKAVEEIREILYNEKLSSEIAEHNYELGKKHFSYDLLREKLPILFTF